jgi:hypothetical protein
LLFSLTPDSAYALLLLLLLPMLLLLLLLLDAPGNEGSVDKLLKQIGGFMSDIAGATIFLL